MPLTVLSILFGAAFTILAAYGAGVLLLRRVPAPPEIALGLGAAALSFLVFVLLSLHALHPAVLLAMGAALSACAIRLRRTALAEPAKVPLGRAWIAAGLILAVYGAWYFVNAMAPEITPDGITYHLGLPYEYVRRGAFPPRVAFYDMVPQGLEMLYAMAFAFGRHSAAKLVEFTFFLAALPLIFRIGRRLRIADLASLTAAVFYFCAPVCGLTGSSSYNDAAGVFFALASFYLLLVWRDSGLWQYLFAAGALAGFCYAIKFPGAFAVAAVVLFALAARRRHAVWVASAGAALVMLPWVLRNYVLTGDPFAPLWNGFFRNPYFHLATERYLAADLRSLGTVRLAGVPWQLAFGDRLAGTFGPLLLALPLGLLALRRQAGRWCWAAAVLLAVPWFSNSGARFLMPAVACAALALGMSLPRPAAWAAIALQAVLCWPQVMDLWDKPYSFRLHEFPLAAALRIEPEPTYLERHIEEFDVARMVERNTPPGAKIFALLPVANAYLRRDVRVSWQSAETDSLEDALRFAVFDTGEPSVEWSMSWPLQLLRGLRFRMPRAGPSEWHINDLRVFSGEELVYNSPQWRLRGWPNPWEFPLALDGNLATRWRSWEPLRAGMYLEIRFDRPQLLSSARLVSGEPGRTVPFEVYGMGLDGRWRPLARAASAPHPRRDLRFDARLALHRAGYGYILAPTGAGGDAPLGNSMLGQEAEWGLERAANAGRFYLFRVK